MKIDSTVIKNTVYVASADLVFSAVMQLVFWLCSCWSIEVLLGNVLGYIASVLNFFLLGLTVQSAVNRDADDARRFITTSQRLRLLMMLAFAVVGYFLPFCNLYAVVIPFLFNGAAVFIISRIVKDN